jgi:hypothetical protein
VTATVARTAEGDSAIGAAPIGPAADVGRAHYCHNCGAAAPGKYCPECGQETRLKLPTVRERLHAFAFIMIIAMLLVSRGIAQVPLALWILIYVARARRKVYAGSWLGGFTRSPRLPGIARTCHGCSRRHCRGAGLDAVRCGYVPRASLRPT